MSIASSDDLAESATVHDGPTTPAELGSETTTPGAVLDRYVIIEQLGRGGMGVVLRAYDPRLQREVALKRLRAGVLDAIAAERMVREAQAMAQLSHPNVVAVYDVVRTDSNVLLAMELVEGRTMTRWLQDEKPSPAAIVAAFVQAGRGLAAAHAAGMVHRDFKPDNVLVGNDGRVRVTDFGLARPTRRGPVSSGASTPHGSIAAASISGMHDSLRMSMTETGVVMGTPAYMAPEQHLGHEADAKADQYALCVSLWQALTGQRPFRGEYRRVAVAKTKGPPPWPKEASTVPRRVVDAIVRGLAVKPADRWPSMDALLAVLERDSARFRLRLVTAGAIGVAAVATMGALAGWWDRGSTVCTGAREHLAGIWDDARRAAVGQALRDTGVEYADATRTEIEHRLDAYAEQWVQMHTQACEATTVRGEQSDAVLDLRMTCLQRRLHGLDATAEVLTKADAKVVEGAIGLVAELAPIDRCADIEALQADLPPPDDATLAAGVEAARREVQRAHAAANVGRQTEALAILDAIDPAPLAYEPLRVEVDLERANLLHELLRDDEAAVLLDQVYQSALRLDHPQAAIGAMSLLGFIVGSRQMKEHEGLRLVRTAAAMAEAQRDPELLAMVLNDVGAVLETHTHHAEAIEQFRRAVALQRESLGPRHPGLASTMSNIAISLQKQGDFDGAYARYQEIIEQQRTIYGKDHPSLARSLQKAGTLLHQRGDYEASVEILEQALAMRTRLQGGDHPATGSVLADLGLSLSALGRHGEAERALRDGLRILEGEHHGALDRLEVIDTNNNLALVVDAQGRYEEALALYQRSLQGVEAVAGPEHPRTAISLNNVAGTLIKLHRSEEAVPMLERALAIQSAALGAEHPMVAVTELNLGSALMEVGQLDEAEGHFRIAQPIMEKGYGPDHVYASYVLVGLGMTLHEQGRTDEALPLLERGLTLREQDGVSDHDRAEAAFGLARALGPEARPRARDLALRARSIYTEPVGAHTETLAEIDAWLAAHPDETP